MANGKPRKSEVSLETRLLWNPRIRRPQLAGSR
jgi:hypothetical protein